MATAKKVTKEVVFKFESSVLYLLVAEVNAQFIKGSFETNDESVASVLRSYPQIKEVE